MSVLCAVFLPTFGLLAADTRLNLTAKDGQNAGRDDAFTLVLGDQSELYVPATGRKLRLYEWGVAGGAGNYLTVRRALDGLYALRSPTSLDVSEKLEAEADAAIQFAMDNIPGTETEIAKAAVWALCAEDQIVKTSSYSFGPNRNLPFNTQFAVLCPPELPEVHRDRVNRYLAEQLVHVSDYEHLGANIKVVAEVFHLVYQYARTVSDVLEAGILFHSDGGFKTGHILSPNTAVMSASADAVSKMVSWK